MISRALAAVLPCGHLSDRQEPPDRLHWHYASLHNAGICSWRVTIGSPQYLHGQVQTAPVIRYDSVPVAIQPSAMGSPQRRNASQSALLPRRQSEVLFACEQTRSAFCRPDISLSMLTDRSSVPPAKAAPIRKTSPGAPNPRLGQALKNCRSKQKMTSPGCEIGEKEHA